MRIIGIACLILLPVVFESCWEKGGEYYFSAGDFKGSIRGFESTFWIILQVDDVRSAHQKKMTMGAYADALGLSREKISSFSIVSDSALSISDGRVLSPNEDLTFLFDDLNSFWIGNERKSFRDEQYEFHPSFNINANKGQALNFRFHITLDDGRKFDVPTGLYQFVP